uniref:DNA replication licensing factor MCM5 n=1 Tax=Strombidium rassoulzadegani TaxID=1082188 RepID=A0A7S3CJV1_9SPIT
MSFEGEQIYCLDQNLITNEGLGGVDMDYTLAETENKFIQFVREAQFRNTYIYREQLKNNAQRGLYFLRIEMEHLIAFDDGLVTAFRNNPAQYLKVFESAVEMIYRVDYYDDSDPDMDPAPKFQVQVHSDENPLMIRDLQSNLMGKLICVPGIITSTNRTSIRARTAVFTCTNCGHEKRQEVEFGMKGIATPVICDNQKNPGQDRSNCKLNSYVLNADKTEFVDQQIMKLQEAPEHIPTGEMPRTLLVTCDRNLTDKCTPGNRIKIMGILCVTSGGGKGRGGNSNDQARSQVRTSYIRVVGIQSVVNQDGSASSMGFAMPNISEEDVEKFENMRKDPEIYEKICRSVAPSIFGHKDIKKAIACLMFGGCPKKLPDGMRLRGDINVLLLGDPSVAKSQFLKFVERCAPISVYTSGKGCSAAGLTASIIKNPSSGEFQLEGGAMVLADGGIVCIDEFDKMRAQDRVAIHEAMEQQTISIAKAGITTILNTRASVLAAANPLFGRYDDLKHAAEQIDFQSSILSRFDAIFIVRDVREDRVDRAIASHVINLHMHSNRLEQEATGEISLEVLRKYVCHAKQKMQPKLSEESCHRLQNMYVTDRAQSKEQRISKKSNGIPITVRQLEAIIRISEAIAKIHLDPVVQVKYVDEAHRIFKISTLNAAASGMSSSSTKDTPVELQELTKKVEEAVRRRVAIGTKISYPKLQQEMMMRFENQRAIDYAILAMVRRGEFQHQEARKILYRQVGHA